MLTNLLTAIKLKYSGKLLRALNCKLHIHENLLNITSSNIITYQLT